MKKLLLREAAKHKLQNRRRKRWQKTVSILACLVVFCTVYALILPALTAEADIYCGKEEHTHTEDCYQDKLICGQEGGPGSPPAYGSLLQRSGSSGLSDSRIRWSPAHRSLLYRRTDSDLPKYRSEPCT